MPAALLTLLAACGGGSTPSSVAPVSNMSCTTAADCNDANVCTADACIGGSCDWSYLQSTAYAILSGSPTGALVQVPIPSLTFSGTGYSVTACPNGADATATPPLCILEADVSSATLSFQEMASYSYEITGTVPLRLQRAPLSGSIGGVPFSGDLTVTGNGGCPGGAETFAPIALTLSFSEDPVHGETLTVSATIDTTALGNAITACGGASFDSLVATYLPLILPSISQGWSAQLARLVEPQLCFTPPCPSGSVDDGGICRVTTGGACKVRGIDPGTGMLSVPACAG